MKVKNVMFAGFAAAILSGVCGAASAAEYNLVTEGYVTSKLAGKEDKGTSYTKAETDDLLDDKVSKETYAEYLETQAATDKKQTEDIASNLSKINALDEASGGNITGIVTRLEALEGSGEGSVAQKISTALNDYSTTAEANTLYAPADLSQTVTGLSQTVAGKADTTTVNALSDKVTTLENAGYQTAGDVNTLISQAEIAQSQVAGLGAALDAKASATTVNTLSDKVTTLETAGYQTAGDVSGAIATATADMLTKTVAEATYQPAGDYVETSTLTEYQGTVTNALAGKQDTISDLDAIRSGAAKGATAMQSIGDGTVTKTMLAEGVQASLNAADSAVQPEILDSYVTKTALEQAGYATTGEMETALDGKLNVMENAGTYLVKRAENGDISYVSVEIVGATE